MTLRIGISACFFHPDPERPSFRNKTLLYLEQTMPHWLMSTGALAFMLPTMPEGRDIRDIVESVDGLVLHGGADMAPQSYGETPQQPQWSGDAIRDQYELSLLRTAMDLNRPVLGVCRGMQLINVGLGGSLYQDIATNCPSAQVHRDWHLYDAHAHDVALEEGSRLQQLFGGQMRGRVNSVHHQAVNRVADGLRVEARATDGVIEAVRLVSSDTYVFGAQWHPEFAATDRSQLDSRVILDDYLNAVSARRR